MEALKVIKTKFSSVYLIKLIIVAAFIKLP